MSEAGVGGLPSSTSGAVNASDPVKAPVAVSKPPAMRAIPKSVSCGSPYSVTRMLAGLTSRCRVPARWAVSRAPASLTPTRTTSHHGIGPSRRTRTASESLGWYGITM